MIIAELSSSASCDKKYYLQQNLYDHLAKKYKKFYFINTHNIFNKKKLKINYRFFKKKNIVHFNPESISELNNFLNKNKIFLINNLSFKFQHLLFHYLSSKKNIFQISFFNIFAFSNFKAENWVHANFTQKIKFLFTKKFSLFIHRILVILRIINQIDLLCIAQKNVFKKYSSLNNKKKFLIKKYKYVTTTSVKLPLYRNKKKQSKKYITFIDTGILHKDISKRGHEVNDEMAKNYLIFLKTYLKNLSKVFNREIIICLHPSSNLNLYKKTLNKFKLCKYKTENYILNSFIVLFHESTAIFSAIFLKKKIICLESNTLGGYINARRLAYMNKFSFVEHNIEKTFKIKKNKLINELNLKINNYDKNIKKNYFTNKDSLTIEKIMDKEIKKFSKNSNYKKYYQD